MTTITKILLFAKPSLFTCLLIVFPRELRVPVHCYVPKPVAKYLLNEEANEVSTIITPISQIRKLRLIQVK